MQYSRMKRRPLAISISRVTISRFLKTTSPHNTTCFQLYTTLAGTWVSYVPFNHGSMCWYTWGCAQHEFVHAVSRGRCTTQACTCVLCFDTPTQPRCFGCQACHAYQICPDMYTVCTWCLCISSCVHHCVTHTWITARVCTVFTVHFYITATLMCMCLFVCPVYV